MAFLVAAVALGLAISLWVEVQNLRRDLAATRRRLRELEESRPDRAPTAPPPVPADDDGEDSTASPSPRASPFPPPGPTAPAASPPATPAYPRAAESPGETPEPPAPVAARRAAPDAIRVGTGKPGDDGDRGSSDSASPRIDFESLVGKRWMTWAGVGAIFLAAAFFVHYAFTHGWLPPGVRMSLELCAAGGLVGGGIFALRRGLAAFGQGLIGAGLMIAYVVLFAGYAWYRPPILGHGGAFAAMAAVTAIGVGLALRFDALPIAVLATLGGFATPLLVASGTDQRDALACYLLILDLGIGAIAVGRRWAPLPPIALVGTYALYLLWAYSYWTPSVLGPSLAWLAAFYLLFLVLPVASRIRAGRPASPAEATLQVANATVFFAWSAWWIDAASRDPAVWTAGLAMVLAAIYGVGGVWRHRRRDVLGATVGWGLASAFVAIAIPVRLEASATSWAWAAEAAVLFVLGCVAGRIALRAYAMVVMALVVVHVCVWRWPQHESAFVPLLNREFLAVVCAPLVPVAFAVVAHLWPTHLDGRERCLHRRLGCLGGYLGLALILGEATAWCRIEEAGGWTRPGWWALILVAGTACYLAVAWWRRSRDFAAFAIPPVAAAVLAALVAYAEPVRDFLPVLNTRFGIGIAVLAACWFAAVAWRRIGASGDERYGALFAAGWFLFLATAETWRYAGDVLGDARLAQMAVSVVWATIAIAAIAVGFLRRTRNFRIAGLGLFGLTLGKLVVIDLGHLEELYRILAFMVAGVLMLVASYIYHRLARRIEGPGP